MSSTAFVGEVHNGPAEGAKLIVTAWSPSPEEIKRILAGARIYIGMVPCSSSQEEISISHKVATSFEEVYGD